MPDRTINFGDDEADARYRIQDTSSTGGDFVLAEDLDGGTVLLEYDYSASEWVSRGPVNLSGNDITNAGSVSADALEAEQLVTDWKYAGAYDGVDADARLDNALADSNTGDTIYLENGTYSVDRTVDSTKATLIGTKKIDGTEITGVWTVTDRVNISNVQLSSAGEILLQSGVTNMTNIRDIGNGITVSKDQVSIINMTNGTVTFESGTSGGIIDASVGVTITDNGANSVGDIA